MSIAVNNSQSSEKTALIGHVGWLRHDNGEEVIYLLRQGHFEAAEQAFYWLYLQPEDIFIDCGAHIGLYSVLASKATGGGAHIISVEANAHTAQHLAFNLNSNQVNNSTIIHAAVWDSVGEIRFLKNKEGDAAYDHVIFSNNISGQTVPTTTLNELIDNLGGKSVALVKLDIEGAESEAIRGGEKSIAAGLLPVIMIEFTESNLKSRNLDSEYLYKQLVELGYTVCEFNSERLELEPFYPKGPVWYKNLFACLDVSKINRRLKLASDENKRNALDILARAVACSKFKELENLESFKKQAEQATGLLEWAERSDSALLKEQLKSKQMQEWAERAEAALAMEREASQQMREWAERSDSALLKEQLKSKQMQEWAERAEGFLKVERENSEKLSQLVEDANAVIIQEGKASQQFRELAERTEQLLVTEKMLSTKLRILVEDAEARVVEAQQIGIENQARAERKESLLVAEKLLVKELQQSNNKLSYEIIPLREFTSLFCWIYKFFRKIRKYHD